jgi:hypothetical protein
MDAFNDNASINCLTGLLTIVEQLVCINNLAIDKLLGGLVGWWIAIIYSPTI